MRKVHILVVMGTRPEAIKLGPVLARIRSDLSTADTTILWTGQHSSPEMMSAIKAIPTWPDPDIIDGRDGMTIMELLASRGTYDDHGGAPDVVLVQGDTQSAKDGCEYARAVGAQLIHLEAGLRSWEADLPEELIRRHIDQYSDLLLCPSRAAALNAQVSAPGAKVEVVGQTGLDALWEVRAAPGAYEEAARKFLAITGVDIESCPVLLTLHRAARADDWYALAQAVRRTVNGAGVLPVVWPVHPRIHARAAHDADMANMLMSCSTDENLRMTVPLPYDVLAPLLHKFSCIVTDSGGLVEETYALGVPTVICRPATERIEAVAEGVAILCPDDRLIAASVRVAIGLTVVAGTEYGVPGWPWSPTGKTIQAIRDFIRGLSPRSSM